MFPLPHSHPTCVYTAYTHVYDDKNFRRGDVKKNEGVLQKNNEKIVEKYPIFIFNPYKTTKYPI